MSICEKASSGNPWDCLTDPIRITFPGNDGITIAAGEERYSDEIPNFTLEATKNYLINLGQEISGFYTLSGKTG
jgi:hypothetical protein